MKKFLFVLVAVFLPLAAWCEEEDLFTEETEEGVLMTFRIVNEEQHLAEVHPQGSFYSIPKDTQGKVTIPEEINGYTIVGIADEAFGGIWGGCKDITNVLIPQTVEYIGNKAFYNCKGLTSINIPNSVKSIGNECFWSCENLSSITIPESLINIGKQAFVGTAWMDNLPEGLVYNGSTLLFYKGDTYYLSEVSFKEGTARIANYALYYVNVESINIPSTVVEIGKGAFNTSNITVEPENKYYDSRDNCNAIIETATNILVCGTENTIFPNSVKVIGDLAFANNRSLRTISLPDGLECIGESAFEGCFNLNTINIPQSVKEIGKNAFYDCNNITSPIAIPEGIETIKEGTFSSCKKIPSVSLPKSLKNIEEDAFDYCYGLERVIISDLESWCNIDFESNPLYSAHHLFLGDEEIKNLVVPDNIHVIKSSVFSGGAFTTAKLCENITEIEESAFYGCSNLVSINLPESIEQIGNYAFSGCSSLTSVRLPHSLSRIADHLFQRCASLKTITIPDGITSIDSGAFSGCSSLTSVSIPESIEEFGWDVFIDCESLKVIEMKKKEPIGVPSGQFLVYSEENDYEADYRVYKNATLYVPIGSKSSYMEERDEWSKFDNIVEKDFEAISTGLEGMTENTDVAKEVESFTLDGLRSYNRQRLQIIRMSDGTVRKVVR